MRYRVVVHPSRSGQLWVLGQVRSLTISQGRSLALAENPAPMRYPLGYEWVGPRYIFSVGAMRAMGLV
jgi:hypothetical protein